MRPCTMCGRTDVPRTHEIADRPACARCWRAHWAERETIRLVWMQPTAAAPHPSRRGLAVAA